MNKGNVPKYEVMSLKVMKYNIAMYRNLREHVSVLFFKEIVPKKRYVRGDPND